MIQKLALFLGLGLAVGCGPSAEDEAKMNEKMALETERAAIIHANAAHCTKLELVAFGEKNSAKLKEIDAWWGGVGDGAKDKLIESHRAAWDKQTMSLVEAAACPDALRAGLNAGL